MSRKKTQHTKQFKLDAVAYRKEHPDLTQVECAKNLGIGVSTLARWELDNPPEGMTSEDIRHMSDGDLLDMDYFLNEDDLFDDEAGVEGFYIF